MCQEHNSQGRANLHKVVLEEFFQLSLGRRVGQVADVEAATLGGADAGSVNGSLVLGGPVRNSRVAQGGGYVIDGGIGSAILDIFGRHLGWLERRDAA